MKNQMIFRVLCGLIAVVAMSASTASNAQAQLADGQLIGLDFGDNDGAGLPPLNWNPVNKGNAGPNGANLNDLDGNPTGVGLTLASEDGTPVNFFNDDPHEANSPNGLTGAGPVPAPFELGVAEDWSGIVNGGDYVITFTGLTATDVTYDLAAVVGAWTNNEVTNGLAVSADGQSVLLGDLGLAPRFGTLSGLSADGSGNLEIRVSSVGGVNAAGNMAIIPVISGLHLTAVASAGGILGDANLDGVVDFFDIQPFIDLLANQAFLFQADVNGDGMVDFFDIQPFIDILSTQ